MVENIEELKEINEACKKIRNTLSVFEILCENLVEKLQKQKTSLGMDHDFTLEDILDFDKCTYLVIHNMSRLREIVDIRHIFVYLAQKKRYTHEKIGEVFDINYTTSIHASKKIENLLVSKDVRVTSSYNAILSKFDEYLKTKKDADQL